MHIERQYFHMIFLSIFIIFWPNPNEFTNNMYFLVLILQINFVFFGDISIFCYL